MLSDFTEDFDKEIRRSIDNLRVVSEIGSGVHKA
jgi:hypothetical protein